MENKDIVIVCGKICSGKNTFCKTFDDSFVHIVVSDVVKIISGVLHRSELSDTASLDILIAGELIEMCKEYTQIDRKVIIDGIRQKTIYDAIVEEFGGDEIMSFWLEVPEEILEQRYYDRSAKKDWGLPFKEALAKDDVLGLGELEIYMKGLDNVSIVSNY